MLCFGVSSGWLGLMPASPIRAVVFDAFGTLVEIRDHRRPFGRLMKWIRENHAAPAADEAAWLMRGSFDLAEAAAAAGARVPAAFLLALEAELEAELTSIAAFDDAAETLAALQARGIELAICSNLVRPYAEPTLRALPVSWTALAWSFEHGAIKPEPAIYAALCNALGRAPGEVLFVGDTEDADYSGPVAFGMQALHLVREAEGALKSHQIRSLLEVVAQIDQMGRGNPAR